MLTIYTNHPVENLAHKHLTMNLTLREKDPLQPNSCNRLSTVRRLTPRISAMVAERNPCSMRNCSCSFGILNFGLPCKPVNNVPAV